MSYVLKDNVIKTEDIDFDFAELGGLGYILYNVMKKYEHNLAQIYPDSDRKDTYGHLLRCAVRTSIVMKYKGIGKGDIVLGCCDNHMDACIPFIASLFLGAIPCNMNPALAPQEITNMFSQIKPKMVFTIPAPLERITAVCNDLKLDPEIVVFGDSEKHTEFRTFIEKQTGEDEFKPLFIHDSQETAAIYFSSGTTGLAKACCLSHVYYIKDSILVPTSTSVDNLDLDRKNFEWSKIKCGGTFASYAHLCWVTGSKIFFGNMLAGITGLWCKKFNPETFWHLVEKYRIIMVMLYPIHISELVKLGKPAGVNSDCLIKIITGGAALSKKHWKLLQDMLPDTDIQVSYALTETGALTGYEVYNKAHRDLYRRDPECLGLPLKSIWYKVVDPDTDEVLGPNQEGELLVRSKYFMNGFYGQPYEAAFEKDGWYRTGDLVYYTEDFRFYITDRLKELMKYRQLIVYPYVLENEMLKHPAVFKVAVVGAPHEEDGDRPAAFVILHDGFDKVTPEELREFVDSKVQDKDKLRGGVRIVQSFPMTSTGKVKKRELKKMIREEGK